MRQTAYKGVYFREKKSKSTGKSEKIFYIRYYDVDKKRHMEAVGSSRADMTAAKANVIRSSRIEGKQLPNKERREKAKAEKEALENRWTISRLWEEYKSSNPSLKRLGTDKGLFKNHIEKKFGGLEPHEINPLDVDRVRINLSKKLQPATVWAALELLKRLVNFGAKRNLCKGFEFHIKMPELNNGKTEDLTPEQLEKLMTAIDKSGNVQAGNLMKLILYTGMRRGELFRLKWSDIDFERGFINIVDPKGKKDQTIPLNNGARNLLLNHERPFPESPYVFPGKDGRQRVDIKYAVSNIKELAGLPKDFRPLHGLRHVYASMLASSGKVDMYTLQKLLTHKSPQMTQRYAHLRDDALKQASEVSGKIIDDIVNSNKKVVNMAKIKS